MSAGTAETRKAVAQAWWPVLRAAGSHGLELGTQILAMAHQIAKGSLSGPLTDPGREPQDKADLASRLFAGKADERVVELLRAMARRRWSHPVDLISHLHDLGIESILSGAYSEGTVGDIEQEVFAVARQLEADPELRAALKPSRQTSTASRVRLAERLFASRISAPAMALVRWCVRHRSEGGPVRNLRRVVELAAALQLRSIADVVTAVPMSAAQEERLAAILTRRLGHAVELNTVVDPEVIGGMRVTVTNHVIDRTIAGSLAEMRERLAG
ncbi:F0F1 ATP synthase subunit delta [Actinomyces slackii]|uniref:ATP synthase subunit delta n=1 Tax=Actinomyces slackii TaxID=52774 RepID=A0A448KC84_9ACTO|nr:F0F1 ATP synthase subunit delta [Actinomyces slackii]VEG74531.1 F-type ATPase subunit delta [Actinomyces slackii]